MEKEEMEAMNSDSDSDSSSSDSSDSSNEVESDDLGEECELSEQQRKEVEGIETNLKSNPYLYDAHVKLIDIYRKCGQWSELTRCRQRMRELYPLSPQLWLAWLKDEQKRQTSKSDKEKIIELFKAACADYQSVDVWLEYCLFAVGCLGEFGHERVRNVYEEALSRVGGHLRRGREIWAAYRDLEMIIMAQSGEENDEAVEKLYKRELSVTHRGLDEVMEEYRQNFDSVPPEVQSAYDRAKKFLEEVDPFLDAIEDAEGDAEMVRKHLSLIDFLERKGLPSRIVAAYEDALTAVCLQADLWQRFLNYLTKNFRSADSILPQCRRAIRNCPWSLALWLMETEMLERFNKDHLVIKKTYEEALQAGFSESSDFLRLWTEYASYLRRRIDCTLTTDVLSASKEVEELRDTFERAIIQIEKYFNLFGDPSCSLFRFWAFVEAKYLCNLPKARELWSEVMKRKHGNEAHMWLEYINFERAYGDTKHCRKVLARAINSVTDWPEMIFEACLRFEREEGTLDSFTDVRGKVEQQRTRLAERAQAAAAKDEAVATVAASGKKGLERRGKKRPGPASAPVDMVPPAGPPKRPKSKASNGEAANFAPSIKAPTKDSEGFVVPSTPKVLPDAAPVVKAPPPGYKAPAAPEKMDTEEIVAAAEKQKAAEKAGANVEQEVVNKEKERQSVFVSNLNFSTKEEAIKAAFEKVGEVKEVRLVHDFRGRSKGFAYVEFASEAAAKAALGCDRTSVEGRPMFVSECNPNKRHGFQYASGLEKNKLFVRNLPQTITKHALETLFGQHGKITSVRIATYRNGSPKGHAYVEFANENDASRALVATDNLLVGDKNIEVAISNPPTRKDPMGPVPSDPAPFDHEKVLGGGKRETADHGKARTQIALMPRALQRKAVTTALQPQREKKLQEEKEGEKEAPESTQAKAKSASLSNEQFRQLFLKK